MKTAVMISIQPKWCELIANRKKTVEVRKTRPSLGEPFKVYIYCTKSKKEFLQSRNNVKFYCEDKDFIGGHGAGWYKRLNGQVIGEFICDGINTTDVVQGNEEMSWFINNMHAVSGSCLNEHDILNYCHKDATIYGWHISDLVIYDKPKKLSEFGLTRPPQSWCYVKEKNDD